MGTTVVEAPVRPAPVEPTTPIKPSEALRLGRLIRPKHAPCSLFEDDDAACAVGAMVVGWGFSGDDTVAGYQFAREKLGSFGLGWVSLSLEYDTLAWLGKDGPAGDQAVLDYLAERGL
jgi:hypothetical protein